jgi:hypothetical protein
MRKFSSYGPLDTDLHFYAPRKALVDRVLTQLLGQNPDKGGHYITVWGPRQTGKTWVMQQVLFRLQTDKQYNSFTVAKINLQHLKTQQNIGEIIKSITARLSQALDKRLPKPDTLQNFEDIFSNQVLDKPLILILDEFDALPEAAISGLTDAFRNIYISRRDQIDKSTAEKDYLLHSLALIGVRSVLGVENVTGSPFNVQRSLHIPNLSFEEVEGMFKWYQQESGQQVEQAVTDRVFCEMQGQPGLTCWLGELLTETYNEDLQQPITIDYFNRVLLRATDVLPNNNILNIISKADQKPYKDKVLELFRTDEKIEFKYDDKRLNFLYMNGVIDVEGTVENVYVKFSCPFVQKRLFNYFANELFNYMGKLYTPFENLEDTFTEDSLNIKNLLRRYERYLKKNRDWLLRDVPRRTTDLRIYEAVYHFNLYMYLSQFLRYKEGRVYPEFPTGNGKIDLIIKYSSQTYGLEVKSFTTHLGYKESLKQAARYGQQLELSQIWLVLFVEYVDKVNRQKYEAIYKDEETGVTVRPVFVETGNGE